MTINVNLVTVADSISKLSISGVQILDIDQIPVGAAMVCPVLFPKPDGFVTNIDVTVDTYGTAGAEKLTLNYDLTYTYCHAAISANLTFGVYSQYVTNVAAIMVKFLESDTITGLQDLRLKSVGDFGIVHDPAGNAYHGCTFVLSVQQFCEV